MDALTIDAADAIVAEVFELVGWTRRPVVCDDGELRDGNHGEPARLDSAEALRAQCLAWIDSFRDGANE